VAWIGIETKTSMAVPVNVLQMRIWIDTCGCAIWIDWVETIFGLGQTFDLGYGQRNITKG